MVGCSDSRVSPEVLFGAGLGELFIVRNAGNTVDTVALGSIEYGVVVLGALMAATQGADAKDEDMLDAAVRENVRRVVMRLRNSEPMLMDPIKSGKLEVVGARYGMGDGKVDFFI